MGLCSGPERGRSLVRGAVTQREAHRRKIIVLRLAALVCVTQPNYVYTQARSEKDKSLRDGD